MNHLVVGPPLLPVEVAFLFYREDNMVLMCPPRAGISSTYVSAVRDIAVSWKTGR